MNITKPKGVNKYTAIHLFPLAQTSLYLYFTSNDFNVVPSDYLIVGKF